MYADYRKLQRARRRSSPRRSERRRRRIDVRQPVDGAGLRRDGESRGPHGDRPYRRRVKPRPDAAKICLADGVPLINIVRSPEQVDILRKLGAKYVLNSKDDDFRQQLIDAMHRNRRHDRLRRDRRRQPWQRHHRRDGGGGGGTDDRVQPLRIQQLQAALHLRRARPVADDPEPPGLRLSVECLGLAADALPAKAGREVGRGCASASSTN